MSASPLPTVKSKTELVYDYLHSGIVSGRLAPGERLSADALVRELKVSKIPIREALRLLESEGLVVQRQHLGATVASLNLHELRGVFLVRHSVETLSARLAAAAITEPQLVALEQVHLTMRSELLAGNLTRMSQLNSDFHLCIAEATGYQVIRELVDQLLVSVRRYRSVAPVDEGNWRQVIEEHAAVVDALRRRDPEAAAAASAAHMVSQAEHEQAGHEHGLAGPLPAEVVDHP